MTVRFWMAAVSGASMARLSDTVFASKPTVADPVLLAFTAIVFAVGYFFTPEPPEAL